MKRLLLTISMAMLSFVLQQVTAHALVVPNGNLSLDGNANHFWPFFDLGGMHYQQVYDDSQFGALAVGGELVTGMAFRPDSERGGAFGPLTINNLTISLSTTSADPDSLSTVFADNVGADNTTVLSGSVELSSNDSPGPGDTRAFDVVINFDTPFLYNPAAGNLLLDILNLDLSNNNLGLGLDAERSSDSMSRVWSGPFNPGSSFGFADTTGLITEFVFSPPPIPEPSALTIMGLGLLSLATVRRRQP